MTLNSDGEALDLELWEICNPLSLPLLPGSLWSADAALDRVLSIGQIKLFDILSVCKQITEVKLNYYKAVFITIKRMSNVKWNYKGWFNSA